MTSSHVDVVVIGAGPAGIVAAMRVDELAQIPLSFPTYAGILLNVAADAARQLNLSTTANVG
jgi:dihydrolipoamide dehydrogenase